MEVTINYGFKQCKEKQNRNDSKATEKGYIGVFCWISYVINRFCLIECN